MVVELKPVKTAFNLLVEEGRLRPVDKMFGEFLAEQEDSQPELMAMLGAFLSQRLGSQDTCISADEIGQPFLPHYAFPSPDELMSVVDQASMACRYSEQQIEQVTQPVVVEQGRFYLQRYWQYEKRLGENLLRRASTKIDVAFDVARELLSALFEQTDTDETDWQLVAVCVAAINRLSMITGGPGTGKTTTVARLLALLQGLAKAKGQSIDIQMVAPTGKAAARLSESMLQAKTRLPSDLQPGLPEQCSTIHRLLKTIPGSTQFGFNGDNQLHLDVLVVDEASMVDLPLMCKLFEAVPSGAQVILLGDKEQLASVEAGSVLSDICQAAFSDQHTPPYSMALRESVERLSGITLPEATGVAGTSLSDNLVNLRKSHRFSAASGIGNLASAINQGETKRCFSLFAEQRFDDIHWLPDADPLQMVSSLLPVYRRYITAVNSNDLDEAFALLQTQQVLCAQKSGVWGVNALNQMIEAELAYHGSISLDREYYSGRPVMLNENDHGQKLYNGDIGIVMPDAQREGVMKVWFPLGNGEYRGILPSRLPPHDTVFAMTIHKSQGSEFSDVFMCLPASGGDEAVIGMSRELLYTGLTRARNRFNLYAQRDVIEYSIRTRCKRSSGLAYRLL